MQEKTFQKYIQHYPFDLTHINLPVNHINKEIICTIQNNKVNKTFIKKNDKFSFVKKTKEKVSKKNFFFIIVGSSETTRDAVKILT